MSLGVKLNLEFTIKHIKGTSLGMKTYLAKIDLA